MSTVGAIIALVVLSIGALVLAVLGVMMVIGAIIPRRSVTSWPAHQEQQFVTYEGRFMSSHVSAWVAGIASCLMFGVIVLVIQAVVEPDRTDIGKSMNMSNLTKKSSNAPRVEPPKAEAPKAETPDPPKAEAPPAEAPEAPDPPKAEK